MATTFACQRFVEPAAFFAWDQCGCTLNSADDAPLVEAALDNASDLLMLASDGRITGVCTQTVHPLGESSCWPLDSWSGHLGARTSQFTDTSIALRGPNTTIVSVVVGGVTLDPSDYFLVNGTYLTRASGSWPNGSILDPDAFAITHAFGWPPDLLTRNATLELTCELISFYTTGVTRLDPGVTSANIQGAAISLRDTIHAEPHPYLPRTGAFLAAYAPKGLNQSGGVWSPELESWELIRRSP